MEHSQHSMTVYRASAGSGKTFTLAIRYIELLIKNPFAYKETLAVTFTNKATEEMKTRILSQLFGLAHDLRDSDSYMDKIVADLHCKPEEVRRNAALALHYMLHDYSNFNVETIDAFFQKILRNLARELELSTNLRVELEANEIESMAVDNMIASLKANDKMLKWIMSHIEQNMEDDKAWNVIGGIKKFGEKIFQQAYRESSDDLNEKLAVKGFFADYQKRLRKIVSDADERMIAIGKEFFTIISNEGYTVYDFSNNTSGAPSYFIKLSTGKYLDDKDVFNKRAQKAAETAAGWVNKADLKSVKAIFAEQTLVPYLAKAEEVRSACAKNVHSAKEILKHLNELRLLHYIENEVKEITKETNRFLLVDTQAVLGQLMKNTDAPFVFEKIGGRLLHTMIDEFQDTSVIQWQNFRKLLLECMSRQGSENLIVGDVKQSIYRWRDGDWGLLNGIQHDSALADRDVEMMNLNTNYRSEANIIRFNNEFFILAAKKEQMLLANDDNKNSAVVGQIYSREMVEQHVPEGKTPAGSVEMTLLPDANFEEECYELTKRYVLDLIEAGAKDEDIAILTRGKAEINRLANRLQEDIPDHVFVSDEAFRLNASMAVNIIIDAMRCLVTPSNSLVRAQLAKEYQANVLGAEVDEVFFKTVDGQNKLLPEGFVNGRNRLLGLPLYDMVEELFSIFSLHMLQCEAAYVNAFFDQLSAYTLHNIPDAAMFLEAWDNGLYEKTVKGGDLQGIRLMTIHKSKGLEFDHVICPYADWTLDLGETLWCSTNVEPFSEMPIIPVKSTSIKNTIFSEEYFYEKLQKSIDNMNMLYVAFTRAGKNLYVIGKNVASKDGVCKKTCSALLQLTIADLVNVLPGSSFEGNVRDKKDVLKFTYGSMCIRNKSRRESENVFLKTPTPESVVLSKENNKIEFRQSNRSRMFVAGEDAEPANQKYITQGTIMHSVLSKIHDATEVEHVLEEFLHDGAISDSSETVNRVTLSKLIRERIENNPNGIVNSWFAPNIEVFNECSILSLDETTGLTRELRPDRVVKNGDHITVIDFKFGNTKPYYHTQVRTYMSLLKEMGYENVDGYLWYVYKNNIEKVEQQ